MKQKVPFQRVARLLTSAWAPAGRSGRAESWTLRLRAQGRRQCLLQDRRRCRLSWSPGRQLSRRVAVWNAGREYLRQRRKEAQEARRRRLALRKGLAALQPRLLLFLGRQAPAALAPLANGSGADGAQWDTHRRLGITMSFPDAPEGLKVCAWTL